MARAATTSSGKIHRAARPLEPRARIIDTSTVYIRLPPARPDALQRAPLLERLLLRAAPLPASVDWRHDAFAAIAADATMPPVAGTALYAAVGAVPGRWVCIASPVHLVAGMTSVTLAEDGLLSPDRVEALALAEDFNRVFGDSGIRLSVGGDALLACVCDRDFRVSTHDPARVIGRDVFEFQPEGVDATRLRRLMSEIEMWLFEHPSNLERARRRLLPVTALWMWGGGPVLSALPPIQGWTAGADVFFAAFGDAPEYPSAGSGAGVLVCAHPPGSAQWPDVERRWLAPISAALRAGRITRLQLSMGERLIVVERGRHLRFWRRTRPWWESFGSAVDETHGVQ